GGTLPTRSEAAAQEWFNAEDAEKVCCHVRSGDLNGLITAQQILRTLVVCGNRSKRSGPFLPASNAEDRYDILTGTPRRLFPQHDESIGIGKWQRPDDHGVEHGKHCRGRPDAQSKCGEGEESESKRSAQASHGVSRVLPEPFERGEGPHFAGYLLYEGDISEVLCGVEPGRFRRITGIHSLPDIDSTTTGAQGRVIACD